MLSPEFRDFYDNWRRKAGEYVGDDDIRAAFDRFFTLWVIYNRLYAEATFHRARTGHLNLANRRSFPDAEAAKIYVRQYLGAANMIGLLEGDPTCTEAIQAVIRLLEGPVNGRQFAIKLHMLDGSHQRDEDVNLLRKFRSRSRDERAAAVLEFLYAVRVNLFHGHKSFRPIQMEVMRPANVLLVRIVDILFERLNRF